MTDPRAIKKMFNAKMKRMSDSQIGMAVGAGYNQATLLVANGIEPTDENIEKVEKWFSIVYHAAQHKKAKEAAEPTQADMEDKWEHENWNEGEDKPIPTIEEGM